MKPLALLFLLLGFVGSGLAQETAPFDKIFLHDGTVLEGHVAEITEETIKYRRRSNPSGPLYTLRRTEVHMILYANGDHEVIRGAVEEPPAEPPAAPRPATPPPVNGSQPVSSGTETSADTPVSRIWHIYAGPGPGGTAGGSVFNLAFGFSADQIFRRIPLNETTDLALAVGVDLSMYYAEYELGFGLDNISFVGVYTTWRVTPIYELGDRVRAYGGLGLSFAQTITSETDDIAYDFIESILVGGDLHLTPRLALTAEWRLSGPPNESFLLGVTFTR